MSEQTDIKTVLIVDDEPRIVTLVRLNLEADGFIVLSANDGPDALERVRSALPDIVVLDVMMPGMDGFEVLRRLRQVSDAPVLMLTAKNDEDDRIRGLDLGADDYLGKPFSPRELSSRIRAILRRSAAHTVSRDDTIKVDERLSVDFGRRMAIVDGKNVPLRPTEYRLLYHLMANAGRILPHETLLVRVWGPEYRDEDHYLRLYVTYLRQKLEQDAAHPQYILTERGVGYRFRDLGHPVRLPEL